MPFFLASSRRHLGVILASSLGVIGPVQMILRPIGSCRLIIVVIDAGGWGRDGVNGREARKVSGESAGMDQKSGHPIRAH